MKDTTRTLLVGFGVGLASAAVLPFVRPVVSDVLRPVSKALLKQSLLALDRLRTAAAHASESVEDLLAEVRAEVEAELQASASTTAPLDAAQAASEPEATRSEKVVS